MNKLLLTTAAIAIVSGVSAANAAELKYNPYIGLDYNYSQIDGNGNFNSYVNSFSANLGTSYNQYFGTELFYQKSDNDNFTSFQAYGLDIIGSLPLGCKYTWNLIGTAGVGIYDFDYDHAQDDGYAIGWRLGAGLQYDIDLNWSARAIARYVNFNKALNADHMVEYSFGVLYNF